MSAIDTLGIAVKRPKSYPALASRRKRRSDRPVLHVSAPSDAGRISPKFEIECVDRGAEHRILLSKRRHPLFADLILGYATAEAPTPPALRGRMAIRSMAGNTRFDDGEQFGLPHIEPVSRRGVISANREHP